MRVVELQVPGQPYGSGGTRRRRWREACVEFACKFRGSVLGRCRGWGSLGIILFSHLSVSASEVLPPSPEPSSGVGPVTNSWNLGEIQPQSLNTANALGFSKRFVRELEFPNTDNRQRTLSLPGPPDFASRPNGLRVDYPILEGKSERVFRMFEPHSSFVCSGTRANASGKARPEGRDQVGFALDHDRNPGFGAGCRGICLGGSRSVAEEIRPVRQGIRGGSRKHSRAVRIWGDYAFRVRTYPKQDVDPG